MENQEAQQPEAQQPEAQQVAPELTITDLQNIRAILDAASRRGAFGAAEMEGVGKTFNKLNNFLNAVVPQQPSGSDEQPTA